MKRSKQPTDPHCVDCHARINKNSDHYRWDGRLKVLIRTCGDCGQADRQTILDILKGLA